SSDPIFYLPRHSRNIYKLLEICDPSASTVGFGEPDVMHSVLRMAVRYDIPKAVSFVKLWWASLVKANPVESYFTAVQFGWEDQAREAAKATVYSSIEEAYTPEMEHVPARSYYNLMKYHHECQSVVSTILQ
ncbi:hypothetical protein BDQ17DRAFT_1192016, partial [Cyathus striatus]